MQTSATEVAKQETNSEEDNYELDYDLCEDQASEKEPAKAKEEPSAPHKTFASPNNQIKKND